jgi:hypothetical protein
VLLAVSIAYPASVAAQTEAANLALGIRQVEEGDLGAAIITLDGVVQKLTGVRGRTSELAQAHLYLGMAHVGAGQWERAKAEMREAWRNDKGLKLDPTKFPPLVIQAYEEARAEATSGQSPGTPAAKPPAKTADQAGTSKKGGGKALLIVGGLAAVGGGIALASGGGASGSSPAPTPAPTPPPVPQLLQSGTISFAGPNLYNVVNIGVPAAGTIQFTVNWTFGTSTFGLNIGQGAWPGTFGPFVASSPFSTARPLTLTYTTTTGGTHCFYVLYVAGSGGESAAYQVVFTAR